MKKIITIFIVLIILVLYIYNLQIIQQKENATVSKQFEEVIDVQIVDKYNNMEKLHENYIDEKYELVDIIIDGIYYYNVGIRTKGSSIYSHLKYYNSERHSYKIKLDYINENQKYKGVTEFHLNTNVVDGTGFREYIAYKFYNEMGVETQQYGLGNLKIDNKQIGLITIIEVINENYVSNKYNSENGNLYKPESFGAEMKYIGKTITLYEGIFGNTKTVQTDEEDKQRFVSILKNLSEAVTTEEIEKNFIDFDKVIKIVAINKAIANVDSFTGITKRNFYIYEEDGKIDILPFDFNISFGVRPRASGFTEKDINTIELIEYEQKHHSIIMDLIMENEQYLEKYNLYVEQAIDKLEKMQNEKLVEKIVHEVDEIVKNTENEFFTYEEYLQEVEILKEFINNRVNINKNK